jgi:hypothetical protein
MDTEQQERFRKAVDRKSEEAEAASRQPGAQNAAPEQIHGDEPELSEPGQEQDTFSVRDKNSGHGKKTADKWNQ